MQTLSLKQLKDENSDEQPETVNEVVEDNQEDIQDEYVEVDENLEEVTEETEGEEEKSKADAEIESWMQTDEATSEENTGFVPNSEAAKQRRKYKALRDESKEKDDEIEQLKARLAQVETGSPAPAVSEVSAPTLPEDIYDEDAMRKYHADMVTYQNNLVNNAEEKRQADAQKRKQQEQIQQRQATLDKSFDSHLERADELVNSGKITEDAFTQAHLNVYRSLDAVSNGNGQVMAKQLISSIGEGSEKVIYMLGVNNSKMSALQSKLSNDPSGLQAAIYLGQLQAEVSSPTKRRSNAPKPAKQVKGNASSATSQAEKLKKKYTKMTDVQERISFKRKAKQDGIDVSNW